ncbi:MAG: NAD-dependent epimerase/dehydratase family protein [Pseudomonadota bacterium]
MLEKSALIFGGGGFLGSNLTRTLLRDGWVVTVVDNWSTGSKANLHELAEHKNLTVLTGDICDGVPETNAGTIFNLACMASPPAYQTDPIGTWRASVFGVSNLLDYIQRTGVRLVHASTSEVYGDPKQHPQSESYWGHVNPIGERACYDEGKRAAEALLFDYRRVHGVDARTVRIFNTYGPFMNADDGRVVSNFINQALRNQPLTIFGDGSQTRSFCYVSDLVAGIIALANVDTEIDAPINLGNPGEFTVGELADLVIKMTGSKSDRVHMPLPSDDPARRRPDITKAKKLLGWAPEVDLRSGLEDTIAYFDGKLSKS